MCNNQSIIGTSYGDAMTITEFQQVQHDLKSLGFVREKLEGTLVDRHCPLCSAPMTAEISYDNGINSHFYEFELCVECWHVHPVNLIYGDDPASNNIIHVYDPTFYADDLVDPDELVFYLLLKMINPENDSSSLATG